MTRLSLALVLTAPLWLGATHAAAQVAGTTKLQMGDAELEHIALGWSVKKNILGKTVYNEDGKKVGKVDDLIVAPDTAVSYAIVGASSFVGLRHHEVAVPVSLFSSDDHGRIVLPGATKQAIKDLPEFKYAKRQ